MPDDVGDHRFYLAGAAAILDDYPPAVREMICDPRTGTRLLKPFPSLHDLRAACDKANEPFERDRERELAEQRAADTLKLAGPDRRKRTPEEQARADALVEETRRLCGIPENGLPRKEPKLPPSADAPYHAFVPAKFPDGRHAERVKADLAQRAQRREAQSDTG